MSETLSTSDVADNFDVNGLDLNFEELDDVEYDLPPIDQTPTLESILNDLNERTSISEDEISNVLGFEGSETQSVCSAGARSRSSTSNNHRRGNPMSGSILRHVILKGISSQLNSACDRVNAGPPTAMAVTTMIAVGTSHGLVLVFDATQTLRWCLGGTESEQGSVSSLGFNSDCTRLLAGFARGHILMFDVTGGKLLRTMTDVHQPGTAVLHVKFTDSPTLALCSDSGGSVFELNFKRTLGVRTADSKCLFSGSRGEVVCLEPLLLDQFITHPLRGAVLVAMATLSKVLVVSIRPRMRVIFTHVLNGRPDTLPLLAWQFVVIQMVDGSRVVDPVLAFARDSVIHFYQVCLDSLGCPRLAILQELQIGYSVVALRWLNSRTMAVLDTQEQLHLVDVRTREELDCVDLAKVGLIYATSHFKGLATGGNVSKALALAGERACYNSVLSFGNQLLLVGVKSFHVLTIRSWLERLELLTSQKRYLEALALGMLFYEDQGKAVVGLKGPKEKRKEIVKDKILDLVNIVMDTVSQSSSSNASLLESISSSMDFCIQLDSTELIFTKLWELCTASPLAKNFFLTSLEPHILNQSFTQLPPDVTQQLVRHYEQAGNFIALEAILVRLDVCCLDVDQVMRLAETHCLLDAKIHVYNQGLADYITPLLDLVTRLQNALSAGKQLTDLQIEHGNKLLVYISCSLAGRAYPSGDIPDTLVRTVKHEVFKTLTCLHGRDANDHEPTYPYLRALLHFDTRELINVIALAIQEPEFNTEMGQRQVQRLVDILVDIMIQGHGFTGSQIASLVGLITLRLSNGLQLERGVLEKAAELLGLGGNVQHEVRETALIELMKDSLTHCDREWLLQLALSAHFYRVCEILYEEQGNFSEIIQCYLKDSKRQSQVFVYLRSLFARKVNRTCVEREILTNIEHLTIIDSNEIAQLVQSEANHMIGQIVEKLCDVQLMQFLHGLVESQEEVPLEVELVELYVDLMCQHEPTSVLAFLKNKQTYRLDETLKIVQHYNLVQPIAYLLEKTGDFTGALKLLLDRMNSDPSSANLSLASDLCNRASISLDEMGRRDLWLPLLESTLKHGHRDWTQQLLGAMSSHVPLSALVQALLTDPAYAGGTFGDIRELVMGMLSHACYERTLLQSTARLHSTDLHQQLAAVLAAANRGLSPRSTKCKTCRKPLYTAVDQNQLAIFRCGHGFHPVCVPPSMQCCDLQSGIPISDNSAVKHSTMADNTATQGILYSEDFELKLAPPPVLPDLEGIF